MYTVVASKKKSPTVVVSARIDAKTKRDLLRTTKRAGYRNVSETVEAAIKFYLSKFPSGGKVQ